MHTFLGIYRAVAVDDNDPEKQRRLKVRVPAVTGAGASLWASACVPVGSRRQPKVGSGVWVMFEGGEPERPVWVGMVVPAVARSNRAPATVRAAGTTSSGE
jgi:hypothetical protein